MYSLIPDDFYPSVQHSFPTAVAAIEVRMLSLAWPLPTYNGNLSDGGGFLLVQLYTPLGVHHAPIELTIAYLHYDFHLY